MLFLNEVVVIKKASLEFVKKVFPDESFGSFVFSTNQNIPAEAHTRWSTKKNRFSFNVTSTMENLGSIKDKSIEYELVGYWNNHRTYGMTFTDALIFPFFGTSKTETIDWLMTFKGIGEKTAEKIYEVFGEKTKDTILNKPKDFLKIKVRGLNDKMKVDIISRAKDAIAAQNVLKYFKQFSLSSHKVHKMFKKLGENSITMAEANPFSLYKVGGLNFSECNEICLVLNKKLKTSERYKAAFDEVLNILSRFSGDTLFDIKSVQKKMIALLNKNILDENLLVSSEEVNDIIKLEISDKNAFPIRALDGRIFISRKEDYICEKNVASLITTFNHDNNFVTIDESEIYKNIADYEANKKMKLSKQQQEAVINAINNRISIITGGPGTGKSTVLDAVIYCSQKCLNVTDNDILLCAPTGKAARRMKEATGKEAYTIHSALHIDKDHHNWSESSNFKLEQNLIVIDECSMIDILLMNKLMTAIPKDNSKCRLILVGDFNQLPSVGPGSVLRDCIKSNVITSTILDVVYRQNGLSKIIINSNKLQKGEKDFVFDNTFKFHKVKVDITTNSTETKLVKEFMSLTKIRPIDDIQILSPFKSPKVACSCSKINTMIQKELFTENELKNGFRANFNTFVVGDRVIQQVNGDVVKNGDIGKIVAFNKNLYGIIKSCVIEFTDEVVEYEKADFEDYDINLAYAISVHKSQGSEFPIVIMPIINRHLGLLSRNLVYTAWTRAKENVIIYGEMDALLNSVDVTISDSRITRLKSQLCSKNKKYSKSVS